MKAEEIESYLSQLGQELANGGVKKPIRILMIGGAYMLLLLDAPRTTNDVDFFWLEENDEVLQQEIYALRDAVEIVAVNNKLDTDWINHMTHLLMYDQVKIPKGRIWKRFGPLHVHVPSREYIFALKMIAARDKDTEDMDMLYQRTKVRTRQQAQELIDRYILPVLKDMKVEEIEKSFTRLFGAELIPPENS